MNKPPANSDVLLYYHGANVAVDPRNAAAKNFVEAALGDDVLGGCRGTIIIEESCVIPLVHKLIAAGFKITGEKGLWQTPRLYVHEGEHCLYTAGAVRDELVDQILKSAGKPN